LPAGKDPVTEEVDFHSIMFRVHCEKEQVPSLMPVFFLLVDLGLQVDERPEVLDQAHLHQQSFNLIIGAVNLDRMKLLVDSCDLWMG